MSTDFYIVGGGASLRAFAWGQLIDRRVIAVNRAYESVPNAEVVYFSDLRFWSWYKDFLNQHRGRKITSAVRVKDRGVEHVQITGLTGIDAESGKIRQGNNSGYGAINLAIHLGAKRIFLLGFDMNFTGGRCHWHDGYPVINTEKTLKRMTAYFDTTVEPLKKLGVDVINLNPNSAIECFPKARPEEFLCAPSY